MANLGSFSVDVRAGTATLQSDLGKANRIFTQNAEQMRQTAVRAGAAIGSGIAIAVVGITALTKAAINAADDFSKMSQKVGVSVEALSTLGYAAEQSGIGVDKLQGGLVKLAKNASDAAAGLGDAVRGFDAIGVSVKDSEGNLKSTEALLSEVAGKMSGYKDSAQKTALAVQLFGRAGADLIPLLNSGADGIQALQDRAKDLGLELGTKTAKEAEVFNDLLSDAGNLAKGLGNDIAAELLPALGGLAEYYVNAGIDARKAGESTSVFADGIKTVIGVAISASAVVQKLGATMGAIAAQIDVFFSTIGKNFDAFSQYQKDIFEIGPLDALTKFLETGFDNVGAAVDRASGNLDSLWDSFDQIDESAVAQISALNGQLGETSDALSDVGKKAAPAMAGTAQAVGKLSKEIDNLKRAEDQHRKQLIATEAAQLRQSAAFAQQAQDLRNQITLLGLSGAARQAYSVQLEAERMAAGAVGEEYEKQVAIFTELLTKYDEAAESSNALADRASELESILSQLNDTPMNRLIEQIRLVGEELEKATDKEVIAGLQGALSQLNTQLTIESIGGFKALLGAAQTFAKEGSSGFKTIEKAMAALSIVQDILALKAAVTSVLTAGQAPPPIGFASMAAMAAAVAPFLASIGLTLGGFSGSGGSDTSAADQQARQGTGTVLGDADAKSESILNAMEITADATAQLPGINRGITRAIQDLEDAIGSASGLLARGGSNAEFSALPVPTVFGSSALSRLLGGSSRVVDQGIQIVGNLLEGVIVGAYQDVSSRSSIFSRRRTRTEVVGVSDDLNSQFQLAIDSIVNTVREGALALGLVPAEIEAALAAYEIAATRISLQGLSADEQQTELLAVFSSIFDGLAGSVVPFIEQFQRVGEGLGETLVRVATGVQVTQEAMRQLGFALDELDPEAFAQASEGLIELIGGIDEFISGMSAFMSAFAPEAHQFAIAQDALNRAFEQSGLVIPATRDEMFALMQSLDATTESGREQIATLLRLAGVADGYYTMLERRQRDADEAAADAAQALIDAANAAADALAELEKAIQSYADLVIGIDDQIAKLSGRSDFQSAQVEIARNYRNNVRALNDSARAAGMAGARHQDLARVMQLATLQMVEAIRQLEEEGRALARSLGLDGLSQVDAQISALEARESAASLVRDFGDAMGEASQAASDAINLLLGDLSPLKDSAKLGIALQALQAGQVGPEDVLRIAQRLYASGSDYNRIFAQVQAIGDRRNSGDVGGGSFGGTAISGEMQALLNQRAALQAEQEAAARFTDASRLAQVLADYAGARGIGFDAAAQNFGVQNLGDLATALGLDSLESLDAYLSSLQANSYSLTDLAATITAGEQLIVDTLRDIAGLSRAGEFVELNGGKPIINAEPFPGAMSLKVEQQNDETNELLRELIARLDAVEANTGATAGATEETAIAARSTVDELQGVRRDAADSRAAMAGMMPRSARRPSTEGAY